MQRLHEAKDRLMTFRLEAGLPKPLENYFAAVADPGCPRCWISSRVDKQHPECRKKISRYFETERQLLEFVRGNYL